MQSWLKLLTAALMLAVCARAVQAADEFLDPDIAFKISARALDARRVEVNFEIAPGYYLYRERFAFAAESATLGTPEYPPGKIKFDETFQKSVETYHDGVRIVVPVQQAGATMRLAVTNQGCADKGLCYPPQQRFVEVSLAGFGGTGSARLLSESEAAAANAAVAPAATEAVAGATSATISAAAPVSGAAGAEPGSGDEAGLDAALHGGHFWTILGVFFVAGVLLSLDALRVADAADSVVDHRRPGRGRVAWTRLRARAELLARHGARLHRARHRGGSRGRGPRGGPAEPVGAQPVRGRAGRPRALDVRRLRAAIAVRAERAPDAGLAAAACRSRRERVRDGWCLGADRQSLRCRAARRRARLPEPDA